MVGTTNFGHETRSSPSRARAVPIPLLVWVAAAVAVIGLLWLHVRWSESAARASWHDRLRTIADERASQLATWVSERAMDTDVLASTPVVREATAASLFAGGVPPALRADLAEHLGRFAAAYGYAEIVLLDRAGRLVFSSSGEAPPDARARWALRSADAAAPDVEVEDLGTTGVALWLARGVRGGTADGGADVLGTVLLATRALHTIDPLRASSIEGTQTGTLTVAAREPGRARDDGALVEAHPVLGGRRWLVATIERREALAAARAAALSQGLAAVTILLLPTLLVAIAWQRRRAVALRDRVREQAALLEARAYAEAIVQSIDAVVWQAEPRPDAPDGAAGDLGRWSFSFVSKRIESFLGYPADVWLRANGLWIDHVDPGDRDRVRAFYAHLAAGEQEAGSVEFRARRIDGSDVWLRDRVSARDAAGRVRGLRGVLVDVTERVRAERAMLALLAVARDVGGARDRRDLLERVQRRTAEVLPADHVLTFLHDARSGAFRAAAHHGLSSDLAGVVASAEFRATDPFGRLVLTGQPVLVNDVPAHRWLPPELHERFGATAFVAAPVHLRARPSGVLVAGAVEPNRTPFDRRQLALLEGIARQLAIGLEATEFHEAREEEARVSQALARVGRELVAATDPDEMLERLCALTTEVLECDVSHVLLPAEDDGAVVVAASHGETAEEHAAARALRLPGDAVAPLLARAAQHPVLRLAIPTGGSDAERLPAVFGLETLLCMALRRGGRPVGLLFAGYRAPDDAALRHERIASGLGEIASTVFDRVRLVAELERASQVRSEFIATMSHELRTPLHIVTGYHEMLLDGALGELTREQREILERCQRSAGTLLDLVDATLDLARLESGRDAVERTTFTLATVVEPVVAELRDLSSRPSVSLVADLPAALPTVTTDAVKLKVILKNLVTNALKFTDAGSVTVRARTADDGVLLEVADTGIGIPAAALPFVFEPFRQVEGSGGGPRGGVGLGLHIVKRLADALGATVAAESREGGGSTFRLWLPCHPVKAHEHAA